MVYGLRFNDSYAAQALLKNATRYHDVYVSGGATPMNEDDEWEWGEEEVEEDDGDDYGMNEC